MSPSLSEEDIQTLLCHSPDRKAHRTAGHLIPRLTANPVARISGVHPHPGDLCPHTDVRFQEGEASMKFGINFQLQTPKPLDADQWHEDDELKIYHEALEQIECADKLGYDYVFITEHHFLEEYCHSSAPEVFLAAAAARTKNIRLGHGIV